MENTNNFDDVEKSFIDQLGLDNYFGIEKNSSQIEGNESHFLLKELFDQHSAEFYIQIKLQKNSTAINLKCLII